MLSSGSESSSTLIHCPCCRHQPRGPMAHRCWWDLHVCLLTAEACEAPHLGRFAWNRMVWARWYAHLRNYPGHLKLHTRWMTFWSSQQGSDPRHSSPKLPTGHEWGAWHFRHECRTSHHQQATSHSAHGSRLWMAYSYMYIFVCFLRGGA